MTRIAYLVTSAREMTLADGTAHPTGYFAEEALKPYQRFAAAGFDVTVITPDGLPPTADPYGLSWFFHYPEEDKDYLASVVRTFAHDVDDIRITLHQNTELGLAGARRVAVPPLECVIEETAVLTKTGQLIVLVNVRVPSDTHVPVALVQLPLGLNLPAGAKLQVDEGKVIDVQIQTCENRGCYANTPVSPELLAALKSGKQLKVSFQNLGKETITVPMPLADFAPAYDKIK